MSWRSLLLQLAPKQTAQNYIGGASMATLFLRLADRTRSFAPEGKHRLPLDYLGGLKQVSLP